MISDEQIRLLTLCRIDGVGWHLIAREAQRPGGLDRLYAGEFTEATRDAARSLPNLRAGLDKVDSLMAQTREAADQAAAVGATLHTVVDDSYPMNLRLVFNLPPFLFVRGSLLAEDIRSVAVVGTREASRDGMFRASRMARLLVENDVTVVSGMALGIDTAAHTATLEASGRTIAVVGTGILRSYPRQNSQLCETIAEHGAVVSQFWPDSPPTKFGFPRRNVTMSGITQGTVVIEASSTSGAKMQARFALEHGKRVFLLRSLVDSHEWARGYVENRGARVVDTVDDVLEGLLPIDRIQAADERREQLAIEFSS
ncbi:DNA processing protein DprA [Frankia sp. CcI49]|nr:hypothetical protein ACG83_36920 [Frankia sp. R43]ONH60964.1 DNA processing protein DprA [Frankia sp. CcI49]